VWNDQFEYGNWCSTGQTRCWSDSGDEQDCEFNGANEAGRGLLGGGGGGGGYNGGGGGVSFFSGGGGGSSYAKPDFWEADAIIFEEGYDGEQILDVDDIGAGDGGTAPSVRVFAVAACWVLCQNVDWR
jgi:hypothetical protein